MYLYVYVVNYFSVVCFVFASYFASHLILISYHILSCLALSCQCFASIQSWEQSLTSPRQHRRRRCILWHRVLSQHSSLQQHDQHCSLPLTRCCAAGRQQQGILCSVCAVFCRVDFSVMLDCWWCGRSRNFESLLGQIHANCAMVLFRCSRSIAC